MEDTVPGARAVSVASITDLVRLRLSYRAGPFFAVMSRECANSPEQVKWVLRSNHEGFT